MAVSFNFSIFKSYDIRGIYPNDLDEKFAYLLGRAYSSVVRPQREVLVGEDVRLHSHSLKEALIRGLLDSGVSVLDAGLITTDMYYFAVGKLKTAGGIMVTASHNPSEWHGFKMVREGPVAISLETGLSEIRDKILSNSYDREEKKGQLRRADILDDFCDFVLSWFAGVKVRPMKVAINPNFGYAGVVFRRIVERGKLPITIVGLNDTPDGSFPKGRPDPFIPENRVEFCDLVKSSKSDLGVTWDADADRVFFVADNGVFLEPYYLNTLLIKIMLDKFPGEKIIYDPRYVWGLEEAIVNSKGIPLICRVGHSYIKAMMREVNALFAAESSGHTYYRDFWYADSGMIPVVQILSYLSTSKNGLYEAVKEVMEKYFISGEINSEVADKEGKIEEIAQRYSDAKQSRLDGISIEYDDWRFCVRPSNTEPLLRLTLEAKSKRLMEEKRDEVLKIIRS